MTIIENDYALLKAAQNYKLAANTYFNVCMRLSHGRWSCGRGKEVNKGW